MALKLTLNGESRSFEQLAPGSNLADLVAALGVKGDRVALEHNGVIAPRRSWEAIELSELDRLELVHFVGGGSES